MKEKYEVHHGITFTDSALVAAAEYSNRYITDRFLPDKAIDLIDEAASRLRLQQESKPEALESVDRKVMRIQMELEALRKDDSAAAADRRSALEKQLKAARQVRMCTSFVVTRCLARSCFRTLFTLATHSHADMYTLFCTLVDTCARVHTQALHAFPFPCAYAHSHTTHARKHTHTSTRMHAHTCTRTHTHTLTQLQESESLTARWQQERDALETAKTTKAKLDAARTELAQATRLGHLARAGELMYSVIPELEDKVNVHVVSILCVCLCRVCLCI